MLTPLRYLYQQSAGFRLRLLWSLILGLLSISLGFAFIYVSKSIVDIATHKMQGDIWQYVAILATFLLLRLGVSALRSWVNGRLYQRMFNSMRSRVFDSVLNAPWNGREDLLSGDVMSRLSEDIRVVVSCITSDLPSIFLALFQLVAAAWFLFVLQPKLLLCLLIIFPLALGFSKIYYKTMRRLTHEVRSQESGIQSHMQEAIQNRPLLLSLHRTDLMSQRLDSRHHGLFGVYSRRLRFSISTRVVIQAGFSVGYYTAFVWSAFGILHGTVTYGMMTALLQLVAQVQSPILELSNLLPSIVKAMTSVERVSELSPTLLSPQKKGHEASARSSELPAGSSSYPLLGLRLEHVSFRYPDSEGDVLHDFSHTFQPGTSTAIIGPTGSGKSTLVRILLGLLQPQQGSIQYLASDGTCRTYVSGPDLCYVPQGNSLLSGTIRDNLLLGKLDATDAELRSALSRASALFVFDLPNGLDTLCGEKGAGLSEGQAQRIAIARALLQPGSILILDEASSALDPETERQILEELQQQQLQKTLIWVTHHTAVADYMQQSLVVSKEV